MDKELIFPPWLQDYNRNLSPMVPDCPDGNRYQQTQRQQPNPVRYEWPREQRKPRKIANRMGRLAVYIVFGGGLGYLFITQLLG